MALAGTRGYFHICDMRTKDLLTISKRALLMAAVTLLAQPGEAQTIGWAHQRLSLHLSDAAIVFLDPPRRPKATKTSSRDATKDTKGTGQGTIDMPGPLPPDVSNGRNNIHVQSAKIFCISVMSHQRRPMPESYLMPSRVIYLTDIVYTASQQ